MRREMPKAKVMREVKEVRLAPVSMGVVQLEAQVVAVMELEAKGVGAGVEEAMAVAMAAGKEGEGLAAAMAEVMVEAEWVGEMEEAVV